MTKSHTTLAACVLPLGGEVTSKDGRRGREFRLTFAEAFPAEVLCPLVDPVNVAGVLALGGEQIRVGLGNVGARLVPGQEVEVVQLGALAALVRVSRGGRHQGRCIAQLV